MERLTDPTIEALRKYTAENHAQNGVAHDFSFRRDLSTQFSVATFRRMGVLRNFVTDYGGDVSLAVAHAVDDVSGKRLLNLGAVDHSDPIQVEWQDREMQIEGQIRRRVYRQKKREVLIGPKGKPLDDNKEHNNRRKKRWVYYSSDKVAQRHYADGVKHKENIDEAKIVREYIEPGQTVLKTLGEYDVNPLLLALGQVGPEGKVFYVSPNGHLRNRIFARIFDSLMDFSQFKGESAADYVRPTQDVRLLPQAQLRKLRFLLMQPFFQDEAFYMSGFDDPQAIQRQAEAFYTHFPLKPINHGVTPLPKEIPSGSVDVALEMDRFSQIPEGKKEEFLWELDRVLKPGGRLLIRESSRSQAEIEYYGAGLLDKDFKRQRTEGGLEHWPRWMTFEKRSPKVFFRHDGTPYTKEKQSKNKRKKGKRIEQARTPQVSPREQLRQELIGFQRQNPDSAISLRWFKDRELLPVLMAEFGGNIDAAKAFAEVQDAPKTPDIFANISKLRIEVPKDAKAAYGLSDLSQDLGVPKSIIRKAVRNLGVNTRGASAGGAGRSGFTRRAVQSRQLSLSYTEYVIVRDALKSQNLKSKVKSSDGVE
jgi:transposase-like protein